MGCKSEKTKQKHKKGLWSPDEDMKLKNHINKYGHGCWSSVPINAGLQRNGKSCRLRWINYLRPGLKRGAFSLEEEEAILTLHRVLGNKWSQISHHLPGRSDNEIKNHWHSNLKKRVSNMVEEVEGKSCSPSSSKSTPQDTSFGSSEASLIETYQSMQQIQEPHTCSLPKVLFAEWLSLDNFNGPNQVSSSVVTDSYGAANSEESSVHGQQFNEEVIGNELETRSNLISIEDILQSPFGFEDKSLVDSFPGEFNIYCDDLYIYEGC